MSASHEDRRAPTDRATPWCDAHLHVYDPRFDYAEGATLRPAPATTADYAGVQSRLRLGRAVVVQPSSYGTDNRCTLAAVQALGAAHTRAIVVLGGDESDTCLTDMHRAGARGLRVNALRGAALDQQGVARLCARVGALGWHLQLHVDSASLPNLAPWLATLPVPVVLDHFARLPVMHDHEAPAWRAVFALLDTGRIWVKLSAPYLVGTQAPDSYDDLNAATDTLLTHAPQRMLWGSDWPHPGWMASRGAVPDAKDALDWTLNRLRAHRCVNQVMGENPQVLYGF